MTLIAFVIGIAGFSLFITVLILAAAKLRKDPEEDRRAEHRERRETGRH